MASGVGTWKSFVEGARNKCYKCVNLHKLSFSGMLQGISLQGVDKCISSLGCPNVDPGDNKPEVHS